MAFGVLSSVLVRSGMVFQTLLHRKLRHMIRHVIVHKLIFGFFVTGLIPQDASATQSHAFGTGADPDDVLDGCYSWILWLENEAAVSVAADE